MTNDEELRHAISESHPLKTGNHAAYHLAQQLVAERKYKTEFTELVNYLLVLNQGHRTARSEQREALLKARDGLSVVEPYLNRPGDPEAQIEAILLVRLALAHVQKVLEKYL